ncbi:MAG: hypothetical protein L6Q54_07640 [Leptospiraceae bacterium]|nr:hypothetical protein [Leptospiraceae bacterium]MCK6381107.1 hypothetical protein [Leptospiraceae bacterium]NUM41946.1 hypothetical protein [Leptospiraceae bacterium]
MIQEIQDFLLLVKAEMKRDFIFMLRYPAEIISFFIMMYAILMAVLFGIDVMVPEKSGMALNRIVLGYALMNFITATQMGWSGSIQTESETGTLEQLSISGHYLSGVLLARGISQFPRHSFIFIMIYWALNSSTNLSTEFRLTHTIPILFTGMFGIFGVAYIFAGFTLILKRVGMFFQIVNFAFLALFWLDPSKLSNLQKMLFNFFPLTLTMSNLTEVLLKKGDILYFQDDGYLKLVLVSLIYFFLGMYFFRYMESVARRKALLSQY